MSEETIDLLVIGAGPCGLAVGVAAKQAGVPCVLLDRRTIVSTIERYPLSMTFFSTPERIEIGDVPFISSHEKPNRHDGLIYYRRVAEHYGLDIRPGRGSGGRHPRLGTELFRIEVSRAPRRQDAIMPPPSSSPPATTITRTTSASPVKTFLT